MYSCHFLISSGSVRILLFLSFIVPKLVDSPQLSWWDLYSFPFHNFYFFALFIQEGFLNSLCYSLTFCIQLGISFPSLLPFTSLLFMDICKVSKATTLPSCISFSLGWFWSLSPIQCYQPLSVVLQSQCLPDLILWFCLLPSLYNHKRFDLGHT